jgi:uncharacterized protein DUF4783
VLKTATIALLLVVAAIPGAKAQVDGEVVEALRSAIDRSDVEALLELSGERLEVGLFGAARLYSRNQAGHVLRRFFRDNPPARLVINEAASTETGWYASAHYHRPAGLSPLRLYLRLRLSADRWELREFVILRPRGS